MLVVPALSDGGHLSPAVSHDLLDRCALLQERIALKRGSDQSLTLQAVALRARPLEGGAAQLGVPRLLLPGLAGEPAVELARWKRLQRRGHGGMLDPAELRALALEGAF